MFPLQSDDVFRCDTRSPVLSSKSFACTISGPSHACSSPVPPIVVRNCKNIGNRSVRFNSVSSSRSNVDRVSKPAYRVVSSSDTVTNISKSLRFTFTYSHSIDFSTSTFRVVSHRNIHGKRNLCESVIGSSFLNNANNHDIANKLIVGRDSISVLTKPGNYHISSVFFLVSIVFRIFFFRIK